MSGPGELHEVTRLWGSGGSYWTREGLSVKDLEKNLWVYYGEFVEATYVQQVLTLTLEEAIFLRRFLPHYLLVLEKSHQEKNGEDIKNLKLITLIKKLKDKVDNLPLPKAQK
jgi:hypothetical protein